MRPASERPIVVIAKRVGRLANRLVLFAHFVAAATEHEFTVLNPTFVPYTKYFPATSRDLLCRFPSDERLRSIVGARHALCVATEHGGSFVRFLERRGWDVTLIRLRRDEHLDLNDPQFLETVREHRVVFAQDWNFRNGANCARHHDVVCGFFAPHERYVHRARRVVAEARRANALLVGVHIRRRDYRVFKDGAFYYSHAQYRSVMERVAAAHPQSDVTFLVCSDEPVPREAFGGLDVHVGPGDQFEDVYALAACDLLIGPPSTYTTWASYYGQVPRYRITDPAADVDAASFRVDIGLGRRVDDAPRIPA